MRAPAYDFRGTERFRVIRQLGEGGTGVVYEAEDVARGQLVALKTLKQHDLDTLYRLKREFRALADLSHPNLVHLYDMVLEGGSCFFTMELVRGVSFTSYCRPGHEDVRDWAFGNEDTLPGQVEALSRPRPRVDEERLRRVLPQLVTGLGALHDAGMVHRDIKPSNVLIHEDGRLVLLDFGLVADLDDSVGDSLAGHIVGTVEYMAPEQASGDPLTPAADWYSVGVLLYEALTGRVPHTGSLMKILMGKQGYKPPPPRALQDGVPADLDALCEDLLDRAPERRPVAGEILRRIGQTGARDPDQRRTVTRMIPFAGREDDLARLHRCFGAVLEGRAAVAVVSGPSGMGKTALVRRFLDSEQVEHPDLAVLEGRCYDSETVPYKAMDAVIDRLARHWTQLPRAEAAALLPVHPALLTRLFPMLGRVPVVAAAPRERLSDDPQELRSRAFAALRDVLTRMAERQPLILFLDDLQWGDADSLALLADLMRPPDAPPLLLLLAVRSERARAPTSGTGSFLALPSPSRRHGEIGGLDVLWRAIGRPDLSIELGPLDDQEAIGLARHVLTGGDAELAARIAAEAGGIPFFIAELGLYLDDRGAPKAGAIHLDDVLRERVDRLPVRERELLEVVSVAGEPISQRVAAIALQCTSEELARVIRHLRTVHLVRVPSGGSTDQVECYHDRIRECVRRGLAIPRRRELCRGLAIALEQWSEAGAERRARYWHGAGETKLAADYAVQAAAEASGVLEFDRAARLYQMALDLGDFEPERRREIQTDLGTAFENAGRPAMAAAAYLEAAEGAPAADVLELRRRSASVLLRGGYVKEGIEAIEGVLGEIGLHLSETPRRAIAAVLWQRVWLRLRGFGFRRRLESEIPRRDLTVADVCHAVALGLALVDNIRGAEYQARSLLLALRAGEPSRVAMTLGAEAGYLAGYGATRRALKVAAICERICDEIDDPQAMPYVHWTRGAVALLAESRFRDALAHFEEGMAQLRRNHQTRGWEATTGEVYRAVTWLRLGELVTLARYFREALAQTERRGDLYAAVNLNARFSIVWLMADDPVDAEQELEDALSSWPPPTDGFQMQHAWGFISRCELALYQGETARAWAQVEETWPMLSRSLLFRIPSIKIDCWQIRGRVALAHAAELAALQQGGDSADVSRFLDEAKRCVRRLARETPALARAWARLLEAGIADVRGEHERALATLGEAMAACEAIGLSLYAQAARYRLGQLTGGMDGEAMIAEAELWMKEQEVVNPWAFTVLHVPGLFGAGRRAGGR